MKKVRRTILQIRMTEAMLYSLRQRADRLDFGSVPAYVRHCLAADMRQAPDYHLNLDESSKEALHYIALLLAHRHPPAPSGRHALDYIYKHLSDRSLRRNFDPKYWRAIQRYR